MIKEDDIPKIKLEEEEAPEARPLRISKLRKLTKYVANVRESKTFKILIASFLFLLGIVVVLSFLFYRVYQKIAVVQASASSILEAYGGSGFAKNKS